ncbi:hypothetical protein FFF34_000355 [Inquilinus sp. KBS0705]|nr:hypothetical protein FFF34_000355 [Inquilinus sp. KBS0705]
MLSAIKRLIKKTFIYNWYNSQKLKRKAFIDKKLILDNWYQNGKPLPPPHLYKIDNIRQYANKFNTKIFIETGTYLGETLNASKQIFKKLISIELDKTLYKNAANMFANDKHIKIYNGDSGLVLEEILIDVTEPCLFWLDGHYSEGITAKGELNTPIIKELKHIFNNPIKNHVVLIDDARCFNGEHDYPTINELQKIVREYNPSYTFLVQDDIIRIHV